MKRILFSILIFNFSLFIFHSFAQPAANHYDMLEGKANEDLMNAIHEAACQGYHSLGYAGLWTAYAITDVYPGTNQIWDMYSNCTWTLSTNQCGSSGYNGECDCYNREHSVPKSWFGGSTDNEGCDIFHIVPTDGYVNGRRNNYPYGEVETPFYTSQAGHKLGNSALAGFTGTVFEPIDEYKGDFARGYMGAMLKWMKNWTKSEGRYTFNNNYTAAGNFGLTDYGVELLMKWHRQDPVSQKEIDRNNGIEQTQGNRNPFIDYPCLAEYLWGTKKGQVLHLEDLISVYDAQYMTLEDKSGCNCVNVTPEGLEEAKAYEIVVGKGQLTISQDNATQVQVFDILGRNYADEVNNTLTIALEKGLYIVRIGNTTEKVMVK